MGAGPCRRPSRLYGPAPEPDSALEVEHPKRFVRARKADKEPKDDGSDKSWGQIFRDMPKMPTTRDMAPGHGQRRRFMKNTAAQGDAGRLRSTGLKGTATIHQFATPGSVWG
jgi:hypothetical protein